MASGATSIVNAALSVTGVRTIHATAERTAAMAQSRASPGMTRGAGLCIACLMLALESVSAAPRYPEGYPGRTCEEVIPRQQALGFRIVPVVDAQIVQGGALDALTTSDGRTWTFPEPRRFPLGGTFLDYAAGMQAGHGFVAVNDATETVGIWGTYGRFCWNWVLHGR